jgi:hypothetical protein
MASSTASNLPPATGWQLEFARVVAFPTRPPFFINQQWLRDLVLKSGGDPEDLVSTQKKHTREYRCSFQGASISLSVDVSRVVWEAKSCDELDISGKHPTLGPFPERVEWFMDLLVLQR